jgi:hypothetical protein
VAQVSLNDTEAERESLLRQVGELEAGLTSLQPLAEERARLAEEVASLNKKNQFLFEELARERLRLESKIETLAEQGPKKIQLIEDIPKLELKFLAATFTSHDEAGVLYGTGTHEAGRVIPRFALYVWL